MNNKNTNWEPAKGAKLLLPLKEIEVSDYRCFKGATLKFSSLTFIIGKNNSGKSTSTAAIKGMAELLELHRESEIDKWKFEDVKEKFPRRILVRCNYRTSDELVSYSSCAVEMKNMDINGSGANLSLTFYDSGDRIKYLRSPEIKFVNTIEMFEQHLKYAVPAKDSENLSEVLERKLGDHTKVFGKYREPIFDPKTFNGLKESGIDIASLDVLERELLKFFSIEVQNSSALYDTPSSRMTNWDYDLNGRTILVSSSLNDFSAHLDVVSSKMEIGQEYFGAWREIVVLPRIEVVLDWLEHTDIEQIIKIRSSFAAIHFRHLRSIQQTLDGILIFDKSSSFESLASTHLTKDVEYIIRHNDTDHFSNFITELSAFGFARSVRARKIDDIGYVIEVEQGNTWHNASWLGSGAQYILRLMLSIESVEFERSLANDYDMMRMCMVVEEPENGLHPGWQSLLVQYLAKKSTMLWQFVIETHSEYFVRSLQLLIATGTIESDDVVINNVLSDHTIRQIEFDKEGGLSQDFEKGFLDESDSIMVALMRFNIDRGN